MTEGWTGGMTEGWDWGNDRGGQVTTSQSRATLHCHSREGGNLGERAGNVAGPVGGAAVGERGQDRDASGLSERRRKHWFDGAGPAGG